MSAIASEPPRNAPCPCGSGKRYKDCHGALQPPLAAGGVAPLLAQARSALAQGDTGQAEAAWRQALDRDPDQAEALFHLGNLERERGQHDLAVAHYRRALVRAPGHAGVLNNLGLTYEAQGDTGQAEACYREVLAATPNHPDALANLANIQFGREDFAAAAESYQRAFAIRPDAPAWIWVKRGIAQDRVHDMVGAETSFLEATRLAPDDLQIHDNLATHQMGLGPYAEAERPCCGCSRSIRQSVRAVDARMRASTRLFGPDSRTCSRKSAPRWQRRRTAMDATRSIRFHCWRCRATRRPSCAQRTAGPRSGPHQRRQRAPNRRCRPRLRIGFVSSDLREHPMAHLQVEHWERIDRGRFETCAYSLLPRDGSAIGQRVAAAFDRYADVSSDTLTSIAQRIRNDGIAILFDLNGYTTHSREHLFAQRPAPIQINSIGFPGTLGADWYDYILVDRFAARPKRCSRSIPNASGICRTRRIRAIPPARRRGPRRRAPNAVCPNGASYSAASTNRPRYCRRCSRSGCACCMRCPRAFCGCSQARPRRPPTCGGKPWRPASIRHV
jgi:predicted O-linked N-acetylglucosamine transferase (SPINDLY family)